MQQPFLFDMETSDPDDIFAIKVNNMVKLIEHTIW
jgi:hypothetical protein